MTPEDTWKRDDFLICYYVSVIDDALNASEELRPFDRPKGIQAMRRFLNELNRNWNWRLPETRRLLGETIQQWVIINPKNDFAVAIREALRSLHGCIGIVQQLREENPRSSLVRFNCQIEAWTAVAMLEVIRLKAKGSGPAGLPSLVQEAKGYHQIVLGNRPDRRAFVSAAASMAAIEAAAAWREHQAFEAQSVVADMIDSIFGLRRT